MATQAHVRRIALQLPGVSETSDRFGFSVTSRGKVKAFVWVWLERIHPKKARVPQPNVIAVRVANLEDKAFLLSLDSAKFFTEPHYNGYPAVMVRLPEVTTSELRPIIAEAWRSVAPKELLSLLDGPRPASPRRKSSR